jgi:hypothetical protein
MGCAAINQTNLLNHNFLIGARIGCALWRVLALPAGTQGLSSLPAGMAGAQRA